MRSWGKNDFRRFAVGAVATVLVVGSAITGSGPASAAPGDVGTEGPAYVEGVLPTVSMAESKVWFNDGTWFAAMLRTGEPSSGGSPDADVVIHKRVGTTWVPTDTLIDTRATSKQDVVSVGNTLYVLSHRKVEVATGVPGTTPSSMTRVAKFTYDAGTGAYTAVAGFPKDVNAFTVESMTMDVDSTGALWVAWAQQGDVFWQRSTDGGATWSTPAALTVAHTNPSSDDIATLVAFGGRVGIMWGGQSGADDGYWFTSTAAGSGAVTWSATEAAFAGANRGEDHISIKAVGDQLVAAVKTRVGLSANPLIVMLRRAANGTWSSSNAWAGTTQATRPVVAIDTTNSVVHLFATVPNGTTSAHQGVYTKSTPLAAPAFTPGSDGTAAMTRDGANIADVTTTKQGLTSASGIVALAADTTTQRYWTHAAAIAEPPAAPPSAPATVTAAAGQRAATVTWTAATPGATAVTGYRITTTPALATPIPDQSAATRTLTVAAPTGVARTFTVQALAGPIVGPGKTSPSVTPNNHQPFASLSAFADRQAQDFLGRPATSAEKAAVVRILQTEDKNGSAAVLAPEFFGHSSVAGPQLRGLQAQVTRLYLAYYLRMPDKAGLDYWIGQRRSGKTIEEVSQAFASAKEFRTLYGTLTNREFVERIYQNILGRPGEPSGVDYWTGELDARRRSRGSVMVGFSESAEYISSSGRTVSVVLVYRWMLDRVPTRTELQTESGKASMAAVVDGILASAAYRTRVAS